MIILLDTSTPICKLTLIEGNIRFDDEWQADRTLANGLLSYITKDLEKFGKTLNDISAIGVFEGPGSFTGLRIGLTVLNTIADSLAIPIVGGRGEMWQTDVIRKLDKGENDRIVMPFYGSEAHITAPRK
ncbi:MAG: HAD-superfamily hydrolase, subfamily variant 3 [Candidatus Saccharibacteria bacterium]|nr:HAD-superfamily hydrolase, subfamily variant 3 [Candidatus Saccharibacteria bacterium]